MSYVLWQSFLLFWVLGWVLRIWGMLFASFYSDTIGVRGIEYRPFPIRVTTQEVDQILRGEPLVHHEQRLWIDPQHDTVAYLTVADDGTIELGGERFCPKGQAFPWYALKPKAGDRRVVFLIHPAPTATYQDLVSAVDWILDAPSWSRGFVVVVVSNMVGAVSTQP